MCVISTDESRERAFESGAVAFLGKPISSHDRLERFLQWLSEFVGRTPKRLVVLEANDARRLRLADCLESNDADVHAVADVQAAIDLIGQRTIDCLVTGAVTPELADKLAALDPNQLEFRRLPVIAYSDDPIDSGVGRRLAMSARSRTCDRWIACSTWPPSIRT